MLSILSTIDSRGVKYAKCTKHYQCVHNQIGNSVNMIVQWFYNSKEQSVFKLQSLAILIKERDHSYSYNTLFILKYTSHQQIPVSSYMCSLCLCFSHEPGPCGEPHPCEAAFPTLPHHSVPWSGLVGSLYPCYTSPCCPGATATAATQLEGEGADRERT